MKSVRVNYIYNSAYQILNIFLPLLTAPYVARVLGAENVGTYSYTYSIANYFVIFAMLGIVNYGSRSCAKARDNKKTLSKIFFSIYAFQFFLGIMLAVIYVVATLFWFDNPYFIYQIPLVLSGFLDISWFFSGIEEFKLIVNRNIIVKLISAALVFLLVKDNSDLWIYILILSVSTMLGQLLLWAEIRKYVIFFRPKFCDIKPHIWPNLILFLPVIAVNLYKYMDKVMLGSMLMVEQAGFYEYAEKLTVLPLGLINSLGNVMLPRMSNLLVLRDEKEAERLTKNSMNFVIFLSSAMCFGLCGVANKLIPLLFGEEYTSSILILYCLAPSMMFVSWANVIRTQYLIPREKDKEYIISVFCGAGLNFIVNVVLIPSYGGVGAAVGTLAAEIVVCVIQSIMVWKAMKLELLFKNVIPYVVISVIMYLVVDFVGGFSNSYWILIVQITVGIIVELVLVFVYVKRKGILNAEQVGIFIKKVSKKNR